MDNPTKPSKHIRGEAKARKQMLLKTRLQSFIKAKGISEPEFFRKMGLSRQRWYFYSWGVWETPDWLKIKISNELNIPINSIWKPKTQGEPNPETRGDASNNQDKGENEKI